MCLDDVEIAEAVLELVSAEAIDEGEAFFYAVSEEEAAGSRLSSDGHAEFYLNDLWGRLRLGLFQGYLDALLEVDLPFLLLLLFLLGYHSLLYVGLLNLSV